jgi:methanogenic corrinoid protein MtbC1
MKELYSQFIDCLREEDKERAVSLVLEKLGSGELDIVTLYSGIITPAQNEWSCPQEDPLCIWREHVRTAIIRTIMECSYPYIIKESKKYRISHGEKVLICCPPDEYHEIGARMASDFFTLLGYSVTFVGANTPQNEIVDALESLKPKIIGVSVTNFYNLVNARKIVETLKKTRNEKSLDFKIVVGGNAFRLNPAAHQEMGADAILQTFDDIKKFAQGEMQR